MKNIKNIKLTILGIMSLCTIFALNLRHAFNNYGILDNMLHMEVLAQSNSSGGGSGSGGGYATIYIKEPVACSITVEAQAGVSFTLFGVVHTVPATGSVTVSFNNVAADCSGGGNSMCEYKTCADFWSGAGAGSGSN
jgi:hypothetical protein